MKSDVPAFIIVMLCVAQYFVNELTHPESVDYHLLSLNFIIILPVLLFLGLFYDLKHPYLIGGFSAIVIPVFSIDRYMAYLIEKMMGSISLFGVDHMYSLFREVQYLIFFSFVIGAAVCAFAQDIRRYRLRRKWLLTEKDIIDWDKFKSSLKKIAEEKKLQFYCVNLMNKIEKIVTKTELSAKDRKQIINITNELMFKSDLFEPDVLVKNSIVKDAALFPGQIRNKLDGDTLLTLNRTCISETMPDTIRPSRQPGPLPDALANNVEM
ncbi:MAG: hypothetical protein LWY06_19365 [Firmicutes bacterium]|nr:hypothetical protein [Bacillota bacterium]